MRFHSDIFKLSIFSIYCKWKAIEHQSSKYRYFFHKRYFSIKPNHIITLLYRTKFHYSFSTYTGLSLKIEKAGKYISRRGSGIRPPAEPPHQMVQGAEGPRPKMNFRNLIMIWRPLERPKTHNLQ